MRSYRGTGHIGVMIVVALLCVPVGTSPSAGALEPATFTAGGSINQVYTYGHEPGRVVRLVDGAGAQIAVGRADAQGAHLFKSVPRGTGYQVETADEVSAELTVTDPDEHPDQSFYESAPDLALEQVPGDPGRSYGYLPTRDGTTLSVQVGLPIGDFGDGPWPVLVNYTGYDPSNPEAGLEPETLPMRLLGYVVVGVNIRGSGCSGGAFDFFEPAQWTDGYDVIETLAHQPWSNGDVGMFGISYGGYSQLYVGATQPPHLRALIALSPYDDTYRGILYPGGMLNDGFALEWATERSESTEPYGQDWSRRRADAGDTECAKNQLLRLQNRDIPGQVTPGRFDDPEFWYLNTKHFVPKITAPTYLAAQFQDEQTGGHAATLTQLFAPDTELQAVFTNGTHVDPLGPTEFMRVMAFADFYVGRRVPTLPDTVVGALPVGLADTFGAESADLLALPPNPWAGITDYDAALLWYENSAAVRIRWETGGVAGKEGLPFETAMTHATTWPPASVQPEARYLQPDGRLGAGPPPIASTVERSRSSYRYDPSTKAPKTFFGSNRDLMWKRHPDVKWNPLPEGDALSFLTEPYTGTAAYAGSGSVDLWLRSNATDTDLEATITEVRPDGSEVFVQSGWLRASHRTLDPERSTELVPYHPHQAADARPLPRGEFEPVRIELFPFAHVFRPGSQLRLNIEAPSGNQPFWSFSTLDPVPADGGSTVINEIGHATRYPSRVVLPRLPDAEVPPVPATLPSCHVEGVTTQSQSLRNQPCRPYVAPRIPTDVVASPSGNGDLTISWVPPPGGDAPTGYRVHVLATGEVIDVPAGQTTATLVAPEPRVRHSFTVQARYGEVFGPASTASPMVKTRPVKPGG